MELTREETYPSCHLLDDDEKGSITKGLPKVSNKAYECRLSVVWEIISPFKRKIN
jgi:hypothetical protein